MKSMRDKLAQNAADYHGLAADPRKMVIQGPVSWALGWPPLDHEVNTRITPTQFQRVQTLRAGYQGIKKGSKRTDKRAALESINQEDK